MPATQSDNLVVVPIGEIKANEIALRAVDLQSEPFQELKASIEEVGVMNPITARRKEGDEGVWYEIVDGLHRYTAAMAAGLTDIPCHVVTCDDDKVLEMQVIANCQIVTTKPKEFTEQLKRMLLRNPMMTETDLARKIGKSTQWVQQRLNLMKLVPEAMDMVDSGEIGLSNGYALAKLPQDDQTEFMSRAATLPPDEFIPQAEARLKEIREAKRQGRKAEAPTFIPTAYLRKLKEIKDEIENGVNAQRLVADLGVTDAAEAFVLGVQWTVNMDPKSIQEQKAKFEEHIKTMEEKKNLRKAASAAKKALLQQEKLQAAAEAAAAAKEALTPEEQARLDKELSEAQAASKTK